MLCVNPAALDCHLLICMHRLVGTWALSFYLVIGFTGTVIGLKGLFLLEFALVKFVDDQDAAIASVLRDCWYRVPSNTGHSRGAGD